MDEHGRKGRWVGYVGWDRFADPYVGGGTRLYRLGSVGLGWARWMTGPDRETGSGGSISGLDPALGGGVGAGVQ